MKDKKMLYMMALAMGIVIVVFIVVAIIANVTGSRLSYEKVEDKMKNAAVKYYQSREDELPKTNGSSVTISADALASSNKMKELNKIVPKGSNCNGEVIVTKNGNEYLYSPILKCGVEYQSQKLSEVITETKNIVVSGDGLYAKENGYLFKGENVNNLVKIGENLWAIIDVDSEGYIRLVRVKAKRSTRSLWDNRYNVAENSYSGINDYSVSRIKDMLNSLALDEDFILDEDKAYLALRKWCIGKRSNNNLSIDNEEECQVLSDEQMFGLPYVSDAFAASIDKNCNDIEDASCDNYNYFSGYGISTWTLTGVNESTSSAYYIAGSNYATIKTSTTKNIVPTIYLSKNVMYDSGKGTMDDPYLLK